MFIYVFSTLFKKKTFLCGKQNQLLLLLWMDRIAWLPDPPTHQPLAENCFPQFIASVRARTCTDFLSCFCAYEFVYAGRAYLSRSLCKGEVRHACSEIRGFDYSFIFKSQIPFFVITKFQILFFLNDRQNISRAKIRRFNAFKKI